jgi:hypothetical protein
MDSKQQNTDDATTQVNAPAQIFSNSLRSSLFSSLHFIFTCIPGNNALWVMLHSPSVNLVFVSLVGDRPSDGHSQQEHL